MMENRPISRRKAMRALAVGSLAAAVLSWQRPTQTVAADIEIAKVPPKVKKAAKKVLPMAKWSSADESKEDGQDIYELMGEDAKKRKVIVAVTGAGKVTERRTKLPLTDVPKAVWEGVAKQLPSFEVVTAYALRQGDGLASPDDGDLSYEVSGYYDKEKFIIIEITAEGDITDMEKEVSLREVPKVVTGALTGKMPKFKATTAYELSEDGAIAGYYFDGKRPIDKHEIGVFVSADGKEIDLDDK